MWCISTSTAKNSFHQSSSSSSSFFEIRLDQRDFETKKSIKMGGGGAMRTAAKVTGFGFNGVFRGNPSRSLQDAQAAVAVAARRASNPSSAVASVSSSSVAIEDINSSVHNGRSDAAFWETDDWDFADDRDELLLSNSMPRVVFGGVPTLEEAKEATSELKDAFGGGNSSMISQAEYSVTKSCITSDAVVSSSSTSAPNPVFRAFSLLKESPEAQNVVASLASDKNVWDAVMQNEKVMEFLKLQQTSNDSCDDDQKLPEGSDDNYDAKHDEGSGNIFMESIQKIKHTATEMMNDLSAFVHNLFGGQETGNISLDGNGNASVNKTVGASFMALAVLAIMVVVLKRG